MKNKYLISIPLFLLLNIAFAADTYNNAIRNIINYSNNDDKMKFSQTIKDKNIEEVITLLQDKII